VLYDDQFNVALCGHFKGGYLDGIGRINFDNGDIYEGLIRKKEFQVGKIIYFEIKKNVIKEYIILAKATPLNFEISIAINAIKFFKQGWDFHLNC